MAYDYSQFYKQGNDIYRVNGQYLTYDEALPMFKNGFNAAFIPERSPANFQTTSPKNATGEIINPSPQDVSNFNQQFTTYTPNGPQPSLSESGKYFKSGNDVYEAGTNRHIELDEFQRLGLNFALLPTGQAPTQQVEQTQPQPQFTPQVPDTGNPQLNELLKTTQAYLDELTKRGQTINPNVEITPEQTAKFLTQAQGEISPYYSGQLKIARENLLRQAGYTSDEILASEKEVEKKYGQNLRTLSSNMADTGFALSGERQLGERNLAEDTQSSIDSARKAAEYNAGNSARQVAGEWGKEAIPSYNINSAPRVLAGSETFSRTSGANPFYSISDSILNDLTGTQRYNEQAQTKSRASELEQLYRTQEANKQRSLNL